ncbi:lysin [Anaerobacillus alkalilacustris]|uniref:Lysin n=1 Tax=Anaerobacillus alkalilacustris TaxID=393763 RepID=A0A1S2LK20_9BACI|nr:phage tail spike protein [Anaerobacillus alkalilacustris]OIJ12654.1 lysin [Anaerobacillus alkalilacustris]
MYKIKIINDGVETEIHNPYVNDIKIANGVIKTEINAIDSFNFSFYMNNPGYGKIKPLKTFINVFNIKKGQVEFEGRVLGPSENMDETGLHSAAYECEGELGYLHDSVQKHMEFRGTPFELFNEIIEYHNLQVEDYKKFEVGEMNVTNSTNYLYLYLSAEHDTFQTLKEKLIDNIGGELQIRKENGVRFLDYLERIGEDKETEIRIAKNLRSMSRDVDPTEIITRLTPLGERVESEDPEATDASQARLTIETVNNGIPYLDDEILQSEFGIQGGSITWNDITLPENLLARGLEWLSKQKVAYVQYKLSAIDLSLIGLDIDSFEKGNSYPLKNPIMAIDERLRVIGKSLDINNPQNAALTIGDKFKTLNQYQSDMNRSAQTIVDLESRVTKQSETINNLKTELIAVDQAIQQVKFDLEEGDLPALEDAINNLNHAVDNLIEAIDEIPIYDIATPTEDGLMSANDKQTHDLMKEKTDLISITFNTDLDSIREKFNLINVLNEVDLDDIVSRLEALENDGDPE